MCAGMGMKYKSACGQPPWFPIDLNRS